MELRTYTLASADALQRYTTQFWPRHILSLRKHGIIVHGVWIDTSGGEHRVIALVGYPSGGDPARLADIYRASDDFAKDHANFDLSDVCFEEAVTLEPIASSPLR